ncbi:MAG: glycerophosphodiester phosphodiesterase [Synoicihabitans sp.]
MGCTTASADRPIVIAHRGASGYLPEHTLEAAAYAHALGADFIEQDLVMSRDDVLVVLHDIHLEMTTNVAVVFPHRAREDGRFYAVDFDWSELQQLVVNERVNTTTGQRVYPDRFPLHPGPFRLCTLEEQLILIQGLNQSTRRIVGIYPEIKAPSWHAGEGKDLSSALLPILQKYGYLKPGAPIFVQCFEAAELRRLRYELKVTLPLIQLIGLSSWNHENADYDAMLTPEGLTEIAVYAQGIGPHLEQVFDHLESTEPPTLTSLVPDARAVGLQIHPYTLRADDLPKSVIDFKTLLNLFIATAAVDGFFTDHPDLAVKQVTSTNRQSP